MEIRGYDGFELIGRGGSAQVFRARQARVGRDVAIKVLDIDITSPRLRDAFLRECRLTGRVSNHPAITTIYDTGLTEDGRPYLAMELRAGGPLSREIAEGGPIEPQRAVSMTIQLAGALTAAHATGVLHRDVKPANVVVSRRGEPALTDFGVAAVLGASEATSGPAFTAAHAAPEVLRGEPATAASDVYSLGSTLFTMLVGESPFGGGGSQYEVIGRALHDAPPALDPELPDGLRATVTSMLAKQPEDRPTLGEVIAALGSVEQAEGWPITVAVTSVSDDHDTWDPDPHPDAEGQVEGQVDGQVEEPQERRGRRTASVLAGSVLAGLLVAVAAGIVAFIVLSGGDDDVVASNTTTTTASSAPSTTATIVYPPADDRSLAMAADADGWSDAVTAVLGDPPVAQSLSFGAYFADPSFPSIERLPATTTWPFVSPRIAEGPCSRLWSTPLTMEGLVGRLYVSDTAVVTIAQMEFASPDDAQEFVLGRSLVLGADEHECTAEDGRAVSIDHDALAVEAPPGVDEMNSWTFAPGPQVLPLERGAFGLIMRSGSTVYELRIGMRGDRVFTTEEISELATAVTSSADLTRHASRPHGSPARLKDGRTPADNWVHGRAAARRLVHPRRERRPASLRWVAGHDRPVSRRRRPVRDDDGRDDVVGLRAPGRPRDRRRPRTRRRRLVAAA